MKQIYTNKIIHLPNSSTLDNTYRFFIPKNPRAKRVINMQDLLLPYKNDSLDYHSNPKLWNEVYSPKNELEIFTKITETALTNTEKIHIENISLAEELEYIESLYRELGYFDEILNTFEIDFATCPITIGVNIRNFAFSFKDYYTLNKEAFFIPPPREPRHQKAIRSGLNSGLISTIHLNPEDAEKEREILTNLLLEEKTNLLKLGQVLYFNFEKIGYDLENTEWVIEL